MAICLGIESTAHTFGVGIVEDGKVIVNIIDSYKTKKGGMIPFKVADHHVDMCDKVIKKALNKAKIKLKDIDIIAYSQGPGIGHCLRIGAQAARTLSLKLKKPIVPVNHCIAHLEIGSLEKAKDPVLLYASGANTQIIAYEAGKYRIFGETLDMGVGNFLDSFARDLKIGFPGGPVIEKLAKKGKKYIEVPYSVKGMDVSFSGLYTNLKHKINKYKKEDLCYSTQETIFAMLIEVSERAMAHLGKKELLLGGGVACNSRLQEMCRIMCKERKAKCFIPKKEFLIDNGAMIAHLGLKKYKANPKKNTISIEKSVIKPYERTDDVIVNWR
ncbi:bifunctional N(6)-L-threonylcarbamoyladenine synthase/serine/threonine protein kinase [Candidatus Woesearchaeota archaeon]|nr:bifunctional N(6)-L-threonylcarbamoyladenine synthase/serine/threonine protein kinase [Candidatus Woesearchaeota archaeon]